MQLLEVNDITKRFGATVALARVSLSVDQGDIHGIVGENGAGKSTLVGILAGFYRADAGSYVVDGTQIKPESIRDSLRHGIATVFQDNRLAPDLNVAQNVFLGHVPLQAGFVDDEEIHRKTASLLERFEVYIDTSTRVADLNQADQQIVAIARALVTRPKILILDEPTSRLGQHEVKNLIRIVRTLNTEGTTVLFVSHRLNEILDLTSKVTVLRDGRIVGTVATKEVNGDRLVAMMTGREVSALFPQASQGEQGAPILKVEGLCVGQGASSARDISFTLHRGEVLGILGVAGNGQEAVIRSLFGLVERAGGAMELDGKVYSPHSPSDAIEHGLAYVSSDRAGESVFSNLSIRENVATTNLARWSKYGVVRVGTEVARAWELVHVLGVRTDSIEKPVGQLSGGTQQKIAIGRWLFGEPQILILDEPTQGVDVGTKSEIYRMIREWTQRGAAVILLTSDVLEAIGLSDRALVMAGGQLAAELKQEEMTEESIVSAAVIRRVEEAEAVAADDVAIISSQQRPRRGWASPHWRNIWRAWNSSLLLVSILLILSALTQSQNSNFLSLYNLTSLATSAAPLIVVSVGQALVMLVGGIDLSVGPLMSLATVVASYTIIHGGVRDIEGVVFILLIGLVVGLINGVIIRYGRVPDLIATLGTYTALIGIAVMLRPIPGGQLSNDYMLVIGNLGNIPYSFILSMAIGAVAGTMTLRGRVGLRIIATGSSQAAARAVGIRVSDIRLGVYVLSGFLAALAGLLLAGLIGSGDPTAGNDYTLTSITAAVVGGVSVFGGRGNLVGVILGAVFVTAISNFLDLMDVSGYWQLIWTAALTIVAVGIYSLDAGSARAWIRRFKQVPSTTSGAMHFAGPSGKRRR